MDGKGAARRAGARRGHLTWSVTSHRLPGGPDLSSGVGESVAPRSKEQKGAPPLPRLARCGQSARPIPPTPTDWLGGGQWGAGAASRCGPTWGGAQRFAGRRGRGAWIPARRGTRWRPAPPTSAVPEIPPRGPPHCPQPSPRVPERPLRTKRGAISSVICCAGPLCTRGGEVQSTQSI